MQDLWTPEPGHPALLLLLLLPKLLLMLAASGLTGRRVAPPGHRATWGSLKGFTLGSRLLDPSWGCRSRGSPPECPKACTWRLVITMARGGWV